MNVVIIDNDAALLKSLEILLNGKGHKVKSFSQAEDGYDYLEKGFPVDVLIVDYIMPRLHGDEIIRRARGFLPRESKVIFISGHTSLINPQMLQELGVERFLPKPLDLEQLYEIMETTQERKARNATGTQNI